MVNLTGYYNHYCSEELYTIFLLRGKNSPSSEERNMAPEILLENSKFF
jgi:hypothetical protein